MRKLIFTFTFFMLTGLQVHAFEWPEIDLYGSLRASLAPEKDAVLKKDAGLEMEWLSFDGVFGIGDFGSGTVEKNKLRYGAGLSFVIPGIELECGIKAGTLKTSGAFSKLSSPALSAGTAFHSSPEGSGGISATLPDFNSSESPLSASVDFSLKAGDGEITLKGFASMEKEWGTTLLYDCIPSWAKSLSLSLTAGSFVHSREAGTSWFSDRALYPEDNYLAAMAEFNLKSGAFSTSTSAALYENPFGGVRLWFKTLNSLEFKNWGLHTGLFLCDSELITASGSRPCVRTQFFVNPELCLGPVKRRLRAGLLFHDSMKISSDSLRVPYTIYTVRGDLSYSTPGFSVKASGYWTLDELNEEARYWAKLYFSYKIGVLGASSSLTAQLEKDSGTFSLDQKLSLSNPVRVSVRGKISLEEKSGAIRNIKAEGNLTSSLSLKNISINLSAGINSVLLY